jgi:serine/threonine-protein kinase
MTTVRSPVEATGLPSPGETIAGKYRLGTIIGHGGMGVVYAAQDVTLGRAVAIKFLSPQRARREGSIPRFLREARAAAAIQGEHVVRIYEVAALPNGAPYIVMEHLQGSDLAHQLLTRGPMPMPDAVDAILQTCEALAEAHGRGTVHRDLKPQNLFLTQRADGTPCVKVLDFGISKAIDEDAPNLTATDAVMGTPLYMSPEQVRSLKNVDHRADIWALGSILFELITASPIYQAPSATALCAMIAMDPPIPLRARKPDAPPELEAVILRCLHKDANGRFADVSALAEALAPFGSERGRASAARISRIVRSAPNVYGPSPAGPLDSAPTAGPTLGPQLASASPPPYAQGPSGYPPAAFGGSGFPPQYSSGPPTRTQETWQRTGETGALPPQKKGVGPVLIAVLGVLTGLVVLAIAVPTFLWYRARGDDPGPVATADAGAKPAPAASIPASTATATTTATATVPKGPKTVPSSGPTPPKPADAKDAGAPVVPPKPAPQDDLDAKRRQAEGRCNAFMSWMANDDPQHTQTKLAKEQECLKAQSGSPNSGAAKCDRDVCRQACATLGDKDCIRNLDYANKSNPLPY